MGFFGNLKRHFWLQKAFQFGREFYGVNLEEVSAGLRTAMVGEIERQGDPIPQVIFFMIVPAFLGVLDEWKRLELFDGLMQMMPSDVVPPEIYENFMFEYGRIDPSDPQQWAREALGG